MVIFGSAYPINKLALNTSLPPMLAGSLRMFILFIFLLPFCKIKAPNKKYFLPLLGFCLSMGFGVFFFLNLSLGEATFIAPIIIGAQLAIPFALLASSIFLGEKVSPKQWLLILVSFFGIFLIGYDPNLKGEIYAIFLCSVSAFFYGIANVFSRYIKEIDVNFTNMMM
jgi:O-acetylserine/cysteine efflux transporter